MEMIKGGFNNASGDLNRPESPDDSDRLDFRGVLLGFS